MAYEEEPFEQDLSEEIREQRLLRELEHQYKPKGLPKDSYGRTVVTRGVLRAVLEGGTAAPPSAESIRDVLNRSRNGGR